MKWVGHAPFVESMFRAHQHLTEKGKMSNTNMRGLFAGLTLGLAAAVPSVAMAAHPLVDSSRLHVLYTSSLCALTGDVMNDVEAPSACGIVATSFDKVLKRGKPIGEDTDIASAQMKSGAELYVMSPTTKTWKDGHVAFCVRAGNSNKPIVGGFSPRDGMAYITPTSYRGNCEKFFDTQQAWDIVDNTGTLGTPWTPWKTTAQGAIRPEAPADTSVK
jgi:hypothetical protein